MQLITVCIGIYNTVTIGTTAAQALGISGMTNVIVRKVSIEVCLFIGMFLDYISIRLSVGACIHTLCLM